MNIYYLKQFRKEARRKFYIKARYTILHKVVYNVMDADSIYNRIPLFESEYITEAITALQEERAFYIRELLENKKLKNININLSNL